METALRPNAAPDAGRPRPAAPGLRPAASDDRERRWAEAMRAANRGDAAAYARLLAEIAPMVRAMARGRLRAHGLSPEEAEDVVQEALIGLHLKRHTWDEGRPILPWFRAIARHKLIDAARQLGRTRRAVDGRPVEDHADVLPAAPPGRTVAAPGIQARVKALPPRERGVVIALAFEGASVATAARRLGVGQSAVRVAFHRALARLRRAADREATT